jgi:ribosomal protein S13
VKALSDEDAGKLRNLIEREHKVEGALRSEHAMNIKRLMDIGAYRGLRHRAACRSAAAHEDECAHAEGSRRRWPSAARR